MQKLINEQDRMSIDIVKISLLIFSLFQIGCTTFKSNVSTKKFSCEEDVKPKSLQYLEQQYRCTTSK